MHYNNYINVNCQSVTYLDNIINDTLQYSYIIPLHYLTFHKTLCLNHSASCQLLLLYSKMIHTASLSLYKSFYISTSIIDWNASISSVIFSLLTFLVILKLTKNYQIGLQLNQECTLSISSYIILLLNNGMICDQKFRARIILAIIGTVEVHKCKLLMYANPIKELSILLVVLRLLGEIGVTPEVSVILDRSLLISDKSVKTMNSEA